MSDNLEGTPRSNVEPGGTSKTPAAKNRTCPFCNAPFTSSSLGRHLDLYIKEKNPKPPDGVHDVEEIRKLRGGVTRRQPRTSSVKGEDSAQSSSKPTSMREQRSPSVPVFLTGAGHVNGASSKSPLEQAKWEVAGVNDLPPRLDGGEPTPNLAKRRNNMRSTFLKEDLARKQEVLEQRDRGQAAELALMEVIESVKAANLRAHPRSLFDFNWFNQSFPAICLRCLSAPVSLVSTPPVPGRPSWPIEPPGVDQLGYIEIWLKSRLGSRKMRRRPLGEESHHKINGNNSHAIQPQPTQEADQEQEYVNHLLSAYQNWISLSEKQKEEIWRSECQRAFAREQEAHNATSARLEKVEQQLRQLRAQLDQGKNYQQSSELAQFPASIMPLSHEALDELNSDSLISDWDHESAILKWKTRIRIQRNTQQPLPSPPVSKPIWSKPLVGKPLTNGAAPTMQAHHSEQRANPSDGANMGHEPPDEVDNDEDLVDAPGDVDDEGSMHGHSVHNHTMPDRGVDGQALDPDLADHIDTVMKGTSSDLREANGGAFPGGTLMAGLPGDYNI